MDKLAEIMAWKRQEIKDRIRPVREQELLHFNKLNQGRRTFIESLKGNKKLSIIGEIKRKSPSAGEIAELADSSDQARRYINADVDAISVLTDEKYFSGRISDLWDVTDFIRDHDRNTPCLRKDFMVHPVQVLEACEAGARAILIIVRALENDEIKQLYDAANLAGLDSLFEIHELAELERTLNFNPKIIGVNNRDLTRFVTDLQISCDLIPQIPDNIVSISESGIHEINDAALVKEAGAQAVLIGEALIRSEDPESFIQALHDL
ncbi:MAG: indole-3-glycerol-phosphate synthase [Opitutae bacterium]|nr:indole-3-glycerol-phosphate synthase [Opitutae bacterium]MBT5692802.1 indole-3-glycerol-phosphate synthase [Opitutae bacterium]MBT6463600.1 indole-3-glycerol-phosphate synthase [Opitutae bacterium]MBT7852802.1 indole-3-glycerol-phosphate synthase [Opitutae bacterium]